MASTTDWSKKKPWEVSTITWAKGYYTIVVEFIEPDSSLGKPEFKADAYSEAFRQGLLKIGESVNRNPTKFIDYLDNLGIFDITKRFNPETVTGSEFYIDNNGTLELLDLGEYPAVQIAGPKYSERPGIASVKFHLLVSKIIVDAVEVFTLSADGVSTDQDITWSSLSTLGQPLSAERDQIAIDAAKVMGYEEHVFNSFDDFESQVETLVLNLEDYQKQHDNLDQVYVFSDVDIDVPIDLSAVGKEIQKLADAIKSVVIGSGGDLFDEIAIAYREPRPSNPISTVVPSLKVPAGNPGSFEAFYDDLEANGLLDLLGTSGKDKKWGPKHRAAFDALVAIRAGIEDPLETYSGGPLGYIAYIRRVTPSSRLHPMNAGTGNPDAQTENYIGNFLWTNWHQILAETASQAVTVPAFLTTMSEILSQPGTLVEHPLGSKYCRPIPKSPSAQAGENKRLAVDEFIEKYYIPTPDIAVRTPSTEKEAFNLFKKMGFGQKPKTPQQVRAENELTKDQVFKSIIANRNRQTKHYAGDVVLGALPQNVKRIRNWEDIFKYVLNQLDLSTLAETLMECLTKDASVDSMMEDLCDSFLKKLDRDPEKIDQFFETLQGAQWEPFEGGELEQVGPIGGNPGADIVSLIKEKMAEKASQGVDDPFYQAVISEEIKTADGSGLICKIIVGAVGTALYNIPNLRNLKIEIDIDSDNDGILGEDKSFAITKCDPAIDFPSIPHWNQLLLKIVIEVENLLYDFVETWIAEKVRDLLNYIVEHCADKKDEDYGAVKPDDIANFASPLLADKFIGTGADPRDFLELLLGILTPSELCALFNGTAEISLMIEVKAFMQREFPNFYNIFSTDEKLLAFFRNLGADLDLSICANPPQRRTSSLEDMCLDGETLRQTALREALRNKGLSDADIEEQLDLDNNFRRAQIDAVVDLMEISQNPNRKVDLDLNSILAQDESMSTANRYAIDGVFNSLGITFGTDIKTFIPVIWDEVEKEHYRRVQEWEAIFDRPAPGDTVEPMPQPMPELPFKTSFENTSVGVEISSDENGHNFQWILGSEGVKKINYHLVNVNKGKDEINLWFTGQGNWAGFSPKDWIGSGGPPSFNGYPTPPLDLDAAYYQEFLDDTDAQDNSKLYRIYTFQKIIEEALGWDPKLLTPLGGAAFAVDNITTIDRLYAALFARNITQTANTIAASDLFNIGRLTGINLEGASWLLDIDSIKQNVNAEAQKLLLEADLSTGESPEHLRTAIAKGAMDAILRLYILEIILKCLPVFSEFRAEDAFSDPLMAEFVAGNIKDIPIDGESTFFDKYMQLTDAVHEDFAYTNLISKITEIMNSDWRDKISTLFNALPADPSSIASKWPVLDVADIQKLERFTRNIDGLGESTKPVFRGIHWVEPRISLLTSADTDAAHPLVDQGGFILEKYVKIKLMSEATGDYADRFNAIFTNAHVNTGYNSDTDAPVPLLRDYLEDESSSIGSGAIISDLTEADTKNDEYTLSRAAFCRFVQKITESEIGCEPTPEVIARHYSASGSIFDISAETWSSQLMGTSKEDALAMAVYSDANPDRPPALRIWLEGEEFNKWSFWNSDHAEKEYSHAIPDVDSQFAEYVETGETSHTGAAIGGRQWKSLEKFIEFVKSQDQTPGALYALRPFTETQSIELDWGTFNVSYTGQEVVRTISIENPPLVDDILEDFKYGLRVSYVFPGDLPADDSVIIDTMLNPYTPKNNSIIEPEVAYFDNIKTKISDQDLHRNSTLTKAGHFKEGNSYDVRILPLASVEIGKNPTDASDPGMPQGTTIDNLIDILINYPSEEDPSGKTMYDTLFARLRNDEKFRFIFEYVLPLKRALALNAICGVINFDAGWDPGDETGKTGFCAFDKVFKPTRTMLINALNTATKGSSGAYEYKPPVIANPASSNDCPEPNAFAALARFLNRNN